MVDVRVYKYQEKSRLLHYIPFFLHLLVRLPLILNMRTELGDWKYLYYSEQRTDVILFFHGVIGTISRYIFLTRRGTGLFSLFVLSFSENEQVLTSVIAPYVETSFSLLVRTNQTGLKSL